MAAPSYEALFQKFRNESYINRCEQYAQWTLPALMADSVEVASSGRVVVERDFQEVGALLTNNLASKLMRPLFPTQYPFFKASASEAFKDAARKRGLDEAALRERFARLEMQARDRLFLNAGYASLILMLKHLIVTGQVLLYRDSKNAKVTAYGVQQHSTLRDGSGALLDCVLREFTTVEALPEDVQVALRLHNQKYRRPECKVTKWTRIHRVTRDGNVVFEVSQQVDTLPVGTPGVYPERLCPWMCPTWSIIPGEHYGRGMVEEYAGGFARLSSLSEASALYGVEIMRVLHMVGAGSGTDVDSLANSESGEWVRGDPNTVAAYEAGDDRKLVAVLGEIQRVTLTLSKAFMYQANTRQAERVTAYELQREAEEAEFTLGGAYSTVSGGVHIPLAHVLMTEVSPDILPGLISGELAPDVTAGIPALGRSADVQNLLMAAQELAAVFPISQLDKRINPQRLVDIVLSGRSVDPSTMFFTPEEQRMNAEAEAAANAAQMNALQAGTLADAGDQITQTLTGG